MSQASKQPRRMTEQPFEVLHRDQLQQGGFAGLKEHRLVMDPRIWGDRGTKVPWAGIGSMVYLADASFAPRGETRYHTHRDIDIVTFVVTGRIAHRGSLGDGTVLEAGFVQAQFSGRTGFGHNEINPDPTENRALQMWLLPQGPQSIARYQTVALKPREVVRVFDDGSVDPGSERTWVEVALLDQGQEFTCEGDYLAYLAQGKGTLAGRSLSEGDLVRTRGGRFEAESAVYLVLVRSAPGSATAPAPLLAS